MVSLCKDPYNAGHILPNLVEQWGMITTDMFPLSALYVNPSIGGYRCPSDRLPKGYGGPHGPQYFLKGLPRAQYLRLGEVPVAMYYSTLTQLRIEDIMRQEAAIVQPQPSLDLVY